MLHWHHPRWWFLPISFSSRPRLLASVILAAALSAGVFIAFAEFYLLPTVAQEREQRIKVFPAVLAVTNQMAIITNDLANLRASLQKTMTSLEGSDIRYIIVQDAEGRIMAEAFPEAMNQADQDALVTAIRQKASIRVEWKSTSTSAVDESKLSAEERAALTGSGGEAVTSVDLPEGFLPKVDRSASWSLPGTHPEIVDYSVPIATGSLPFGGVRVGVADVATAGINRIRIFAYTALVLLVIGVGLTSLWVASGVDQGFGEELARNVEAVRKEMESRIRHLEAEHARREEENPITPSEFLSLLDFARKVSGSLDYNEVLALAIHTCLQVMNVRDASIFVLDSASSELVGRIGHDENGIMADDEMAKIRVPVGKGDIGSAAEFGTTTTIDSPKPGSGVVSALVSRGRTIGVILVRNKLNGRPFIKKDQTIIRIFSGLLANAMENAAIVHHLGQASTTTAAGA